MKPPIKRRRSRSQLTGTHSEASKKTKHVVRLKILVVAKSPSDQTLATLQLRHYRGEQIEFINEVRTAASVEEAFAELNHWHPDAALVSYRIPWNPHRELQNCVYLKTLKETQTIRSHTEKIYEYYDKEPMLCGPHILRECEKIGTRLFSFFWDDNHSAYYVRRFEDFLHEAEFGGPLTGRTLYIRGRMEGGRQIWEHFLSSLERMCLHPDDGLMREGREKILRDVFPEISSLFRRSPA